MSRRRKLLHRAIRRFERSKRPRGRVYRWWDAALYIRGRLVGLYPAVIEYSELPQANKPMLSTTVYVEMEMSAR